ncbi:MAG TPA: hypothetical protein ENK43_07840 [Planctomycetes bacterium]|nr:hypothetical protein [Planctomycetota bacterium]
MNGDETKRLLEDVTGPVLRLAARSDPEVVDVLVATAAEVRMIAPEHVARSEGEVFEEWDLPSRVEDPGTVEEVLQEEELFGALFVSGLPASTSDAPRLLDRALSRLGDGAPVWIEVAQGRVRVDRIRGLLEGTCSDVVSRTVDGGWVLTGRRHAPGRDSLVSLQAVAGLAVVVVSTTGEALELEETLASVLFHLNPMSEVVLVLDDAGGVSDDLFGMSAHASTPVALLRTGGLGRCRALSQGLETLDQEFALVVQPGWRMAAAALRALAAGWRVEAGTSGCLAGELGLRGDFSGVLLARRKDLVGALDGSADFGAVLEALSLMGDLAALPFPVLVGAGNESILR